MAILANLKVPKTVSKILKRLDTYAKNSFSKILVKKNAHYYGEHFGL
jgi:hypothetical protein